MTDKERDRIECAIRHIQTAVDVDPWAAEIAVAAMKELFGNSEQLDTISRAAAIDAALTYLVEYCGAAFDEDMQRMLKERLDSLPSARKKGHWIDEGTNYACSECHRGCWVNSNYCPWCGADMRGEDDE